jgi:hypothetical protein
MLTDTPLKHIHKYASRDEPCPSNADLKAESDFLDVLPTLLSWSQEVQKKKLAKNGVITLDRKEAGGYLDLVEHYCRVVNMLFLFEAHEMTNEPETTRWLLHGHSLYGAMSVGFFKTTGQMHVSGLQTLDVIRTGLVFHYKCKHLLSKEDLDRQRSFDSILKPLIPMIRSQVEPHLTRKS